MPVRFTFVYYITVIGRSQAPAVVKHDTDPHYPVQLEDIGFEDASINSDDSDGSSSVEEAAGFGLV